MAAHHAGGALHAAAAANAEARTAHIKELASKSKENVDEELKKEELRNHWPFLRKAGYELVQSHYFEAACGVVILLNMALVVVETDAGADDGSPPFWAEVLTNCFLAIYTIELTIKLYVFRVDFFREMWNVLDFVIVGIDLVFLLIGFIVDELPNFSILRVFRLVRLARAFKAAKSFQELNSLLRACTCAMKAIFWGMVMIIMTLTVWGILAVQLIHPINIDLPSKKPDIYDGCDRCLRSFSTVFQSILTFWKQIVAGDSWGQVCEPIIEEAPWTMVFFMLVLVTVNLTMLNCILAVVVEAGAAAAAADEHDRAIDEQKVVAQAEGKLVVLCQGLDSDDSGSITIEEMMSGFHGNQEFRECLELMHVTESDMSMIFNICDEDDSGDVDYREFVEQLRRIKHSGEQMLLHYVTDIRHSVLKSEHEITKLMQKHIEQEQLLEKKLDQTNEELKTLEPFVIREQHELEQKLHQASESFKAQEMLKPNPGHVTQLRASFDQVSATEVAESKAGVEAEIGGSLASAVTAMGQRPRELKSGEGLSPDKVGDAVPTSDDLMRIVTPRFVGTLAKQAGTPLEAVQAIHGNADYEAVAHQSAVLLQSGNHAAGASPNSLQTGVVLSLNAAPTLGCGDCCSIPAAKPLHKS